MAGTSPELPAARSEPDPRGSLSTPHELLPILPHSCQSHKHFQESIHSISGSWQRDRLFKTRYSCNIKNPPEIDIVAWLYLFVWPQPASTTGNQKWGQPSALNSLPQHKGADKELATACRVQLCNFAVAWCHLPMSTGIWTPPAPLLTEHPGSAPLPIASNHINTLLHQCFWSAECYFTARKTIKRSSWFLKETVHSHTAWCNSEVTLL